jgi:small multidrug resistance pump
MAYLYLAFAIGFEVIATSLIKKSDGFANLYPTVGMLTCYLGAFFFLSIVVKTIPLGIVYATWSAGGIVLISAVGYYVYKQALDLPAIIGLGFIIAGVVVINLFSKTVAH